MMEPAPPTMRASWWKVREPQIGISEPGETIQHNTVSMDSILQVYIVRPVRLRSSQVALQVRFMIGILIDRVEWLEGWSKKQSQ